MTAPAAVAGARAVCDACGAGLAPGQEYCLDCGRRRSRSAVGATEPPWRRAGPWYTASWVWPAAAALVVATLAASVAVAIRLADDGAEPVLVATLAQAEAPSAETVLPENPPAAPLPAPTSTEAAAPPPATPARRGGSLVEWPAGRNGWTVVLASLPQQSGRGVAIERAKAASRAGVPNVGILDADEFSTFHPGYLVVFSGVHRTEAAAQDAAEEAQDEGYRDAYAREVAR